MSVFMRIENDDEPFSNARFLDLDVPTLQDDSEGPTCRICNDATNNEDNPLISVYIVYIV